MFCFILSFYPHQSECVCCVLVFVASNGIIVPQVLPIHETGTPAFTIIEEEEPETEVDDGGQTAP